MVRFSAQDSTQLEAALLALKSEKLDGVLVSGDLLLLQNKSQIAKTLRELRVPSVFSWPEYHTEEALASYAPNLSEAMNRAASHVDSILKGKNPAAIPIDQMSTYQLILDLRVVRAMEIQVPDELRIRADRVIK